MDFAQRWVKYLLGTLLFFAFIFMNLFLVLYLSLDYENVELKISSVLPAGVNQSIISEIYYKEYNCSFFDCLEKGYDPFFVVSKHSQDYWEFWAFLSIFVVIFLTVGLFYAMNNNIHFLITLGSTLVGASLAFSTVNIFLILSNILGISVFTDFILIMFSEVTNVFFVLFGFGLALIVCGFALKFFDFGENIIEKIKGE